MSHYVETGHFGETCPGHLHAGIDMAVPEGTPIHAAACGTVSLTQTPGQSGGYGNLICVQHTSAMTTCYAHLERFAAHHGEYVEVGQVIGYVGQTGDATDPHVHFETRLNGKPVNPQPYLDGKTMPGRFPADGHTARARTATAHAHRDHHGERAALRAHSVEAARQATAGAPQPPSMKTATPAPPLSAPEPATPAAATPQAAGAPSTTQTPVAASPATSVSSPSTPVPSPTPGAPSEAGQTAGTDTTAPS